MHEHLPVLDRDELLYLALAIHDEPQRYRLHPACRLTASHLVAHERTQLEADEPVQDATCLLCIYQLIIDRTRVSKRTLDRILRYLMEHHAARRLCRDTQQMREVPRYRLALTVRVRRQINIRTGRRALQTRHDLTTIRRHHIPRLEVLLYINTKSAVRQIAHMANRCLNVVAGAKIPLDRPRLRSRLHDHKLLGSVPICS